MTPLTLFAAPHNAFVIRGVARTSGEGARGMNGHESRADFRFIVDGLELSAEQHGQIASAIQEAGMKALAKLDLDQPIAAIDLGGVLRGIEWRGRYALVGPGAEELAPKLSSFIGM